MFFDYNLRGDFSHCYSIFNCTFRSIKGGIMKISELLEKYETEHKKIIAQRGGVLIHSKEPVSDKIYAANFALIKAIAPHLKDLRELENIVTKKINQGY